MELSTVVLVSQSMKYLRTAMDEMRVYVLFRTFVSVNKITAKRLKDRTCSGSKMSVQDLFHKKSCNIYASMYYFSIRLKQCTRSAIDFTVKRIYTFFFSVIE